MFFRKPPLFYQNYDNGIRTHTARVKVLCATITPYRNKTTETGFEPVPTESESVMLPLHHSAWGD